MSPLERAETSLAEAARLVDSAARALAEAASQADEVSPNQRMGYAERNREQIAQASRVTFEKPNLDQACYLATEYGKAAARLHDWANGLHAYNAGLRK